MLEVDFRQRRAAVRWHALVDDRFDMAILGFELGQPASRTAAAAVTLTVLPLRSDRPIYLQDEVKPKIAGGQVAEVRRVRIVPEYALDLTPGG